LRRLATGEPYSSLETSFQISKTVLVDFCHKFLHVYIDIQRFQTIYYTTLTHGYAYTHVYTRCESVRKIIERVFDMLKKRFRILRLPMLVKDMTEVEHIVKVCCVLHNMCLQVH
jgi:hypothetical protein